MSDDIVTRLRICESEYGSGDVCKEAADEIEQLRLDIAYIVNALLMISDGIATVAQLETWLKHKGHKS